MHSQFEADGLTVVTVALDLDPAQARPWIEAAAPTHPSLIDSQHRVDELFGIVNVPMAVWIDESGTIVRPAEVASIEPSPLRGMEVSDELPERMRVALTEIKKFPDEASAYRAAIGDWVANGDKSRFVMEPHEVVEASGARPVEHSAAAAHFALGCHLEHTVGHDAAVEHWKAAHLLHPQNWTYKRQAWTLETTAAGEPSDLSQEAFDTYGTSWLDDVLALGGGDSYYRPPSL